MSEPLLQLEGVTVGYDRHAVLRDVNLDIQRGSFSGLLGTNGSGKSTLIKAILGIIPVLAGQICFTPHEPALGYVPQRESLDAIFLLSSFEVVLMGSCGRVGPGRRFGTEEKDWAHHCLKETGVDDLHRKPFSQLSGGQKQRVLIARALATKPGFLLLDEPTAGIDAAASQIIMELLQRIHHQQKLTILMVNHDLPTVRKHVQDVIWLRNGKIVQGKASDLLSREKLEHLFDLEFS